MHAGTIQSSAIGISLFFLAQSAAAAELMTVQTPVQGQYIVVLKDEYATLAFEPQSAGRPSVKSAAKQFSAALGVDVLHTYDHVLRGFSIRANDAQLAKLLADPRVKYVAEDGIASTTATQQNPQWGLDRVDQRDLPLDRAYRYDLTGSRVHVYVIDSGIRQSHTQFAGRVGRGASFIEDGQGVEDCIGHGTHVSGTIAGTTWGVAKQAIIHPIRVFGCTNQGEFSTVIAGIDWVAANRELPAVANFSVGIQANTVVDDAISALIERNITVVVAAGNRNEDACNTSPARLQRAITVAATDRNDNRWVEPAFGSNYGPCIDLFAPGFDITSAWHTSDHDSATHKGTSTAAPHVTGAVAQYLQANPKATPDEVAREIVGKSSIGRIGNPGEGSPNHLLWTRFQDTRRYAWFRYYNRERGGHFYTTNWSELGASSPDWRYEGVTGYVQLRADGNTRPLHHYHSSRGAGHFYTTNFDELGNGRNGWTYEGITGHVPNNAAADTADLHRYLFPQTTAHFYTTNFDELGGGHSGWVYEGIQSQIWTRP